MRSDTILQPVLRRTLDQGNGVLTIMEPLRDGSEMSGLFEAFPKANEIRQEVSTRSAMNNRARSRTSAKGRGYCTLPPRSVHQYCGLASIENMWVPYPAGVDVRPIPETGLVEHLREGTRLCAMGTDGPNVSHFSPMGPNSI